MTYLQAPAAAQRAPRSATHPSPRVTALAGNREHLRVALAAKRAAIVRRETAWVAAAEADAARLGDRNVRMDDRSTWDRATWDRYLMAASSHEPDYKPRIRRLLQEIDSLEALLAMPGAPATRAA